MHARLLVGAAAGLSAMASACGSSASVPPAPPGSLGPTPSRPPASVVPGPPAPPPLVAVLEPSRSASTLRLLRLDGSEVAHAAVTGQYVGDDRSARLYFSDGRRLQAVSRTGAVRLLATFTSPARGVAVDAAGDRWMWSVEEPAAGSAFRTEVFLGGHGIPAHLVVDHVEAARYLVPVRWDGKDVIVQHLPTGIGGVSAFPDDFVFATSRLDPSTGSLTPLTPETCHLSAVGPDGTVACILSPRGADQRMAIRFLSPGGRTVDVQLPPGTVDAGLVRFSPDGMRAAAGIARAHLGSEGLPFAYATVIVDRGTGGARPLGPDGVEPVAWVDGGTLVVTRPAAAAGSRGTYLVQVGAAGRTVEIAPRPGAIAVVP